MDRLALASSFKMFILQAFFILLLTSCALAGPTRYRSTSLLPSCVSYCNGASKFLYETGNTYVYDYKTDIQTLVLEETTQKSHIQLFAKVEIVAITSCDFSLQLKEVEVTDLGNVMDSVQKVQDEDFFKTALQRHSIRFAFQDGAIEHLCSNPEEPLWVTNVKRGILSMFQNSMENLNSDAIIHEVDVNGKCPTHYNISLDSSWGESRTFTKNKDLSSCSQRQNQVTAIQSIPYTSNSAQSQGMGLLSGSVECRQFILNNKFEKVECQEEQKFKPFENKNSGAKNLITQSLVYSSTNTANESPQDEAEMRRKSLIFEIDGTTAETKSNLDTLMNLLETIEKSSTPNIKAETPALFVELVENLRLINEEALRSLLAKTTSNAKIKFLMDAIPLVNSAPSLAIMRDFFLEGKLGTDQVDSWLRSVTFIKHPSLSMISVLSTLLDQNPSSSILLSISSLMNSYCKNFADCSKENVIREAIDKIVSPLKETCQISSDVQDIRQAVVALKALGNVGIYPSPTTSVTNSLLIQNCFTQKYNPIEVRLAAIDAYRRIPCSSFSSNKFLMLYSDSTENTEIRIKAYLVAMNCADRKTIDTVQNVMHTEVVNQVGSFVWTHLTNLQETNRPDKQMIKTLLSNEILKNKFQTDARKFSRSFESSMFSDEYNAGAGIDANLIFTEESFIPKSAMVNLTVQLFGETVNLFEFGGRVHATERLLEPIFGPGGYFPDESMTDFLKNTRRKREVPSNTIDRLPSVYEQAAANLDTPGGSFYARIFGHEFIHKDFEINTDSTIPNVVDENGRNWFNMKGLLDNLSTGKKADFKKSTILMDVSYSVSTSAGIPLSLGFKAAATVGITAEGKFNVGKFIEKKELEIYGLLRPNTAINIDASLTVRLGARNRYVRSGLSVRNVLRSSTAVETQLDIKGYKAIKAAFNLPQDRQDIFEASSKVLLVRASGIESILEPLPGTPKIQNSACLMDKYTDVMGLKLCGEMTIPDYFTLTPSTPARAILYLEKTDTFNGYSIDYNFESNSSATNLNIVFDTPGSKVSRRTALKFFKETTIGNFKAALEAPNKLIKASGIYSRLQKSFDISIMNDEDRLFHLKSSLQHSGNKIEPKFHLELFKRPLAELNGVIEIPNTNEDKKKATVDLVLQHVTEKPIRINGNFVSDGDFQEVTLGVESYYLTGNLRSQIKNRNGHLSTKAWLEYSWKHGEISTIDISAKLGRSQKGALTKLSSGASFIMSNYPDHSVEFLWESLTSSGFCENTAKLGIGKSTWEAHTFFNKQSTRDTNELRVQFSLANLKHNLDYFLEFSHKMMGHSISTRFIGRTDAANEVNAKFEYDTISRQFLKKNLTAEVTWPGTEYSFQAALQEKRKGEFEGELLINLNNFKEMKGTITYINNSSNLKLDHLLEFRARGFSSVPISGSLGFSATDKQSHIGCQILFEGKKPYNSRLSTSIDYSHIRNTHKIEAKVTFNEKKYNGEVVFGHIKSGTRHIMVDLLLENHIFMEAKMTGKFPEKLVASLTLVPDKDNYPENKLELNGALDPQNIDLYLNYFGEKMNFDGEYGEGSIRGEAVWSKDKRLMITAKLSNTSLSKGSASIYVITPLDGFQNVSLYWEHELIPGRWESQFGGNIEQNSMFLQLNGATSPADLTATAVADITGYPRVEGNVIIVRNENSKKLQLSFMKGNQGGLLNFDYVNGQDASIIKIDFRGCKFLPEILFEWNQQLSDLNISTLQLAWALPNTERSVIHLELEKRFDPKSYKFSVATPWDTWKTMKGGFTIDQMTSTYKIEIGNTGDLNLIPSKISIGIQGKLESFDHYATIIWRSKQMKISLEGSAGNWHHADIIGGLKFTGHDYTFHLISKHENGVHKVEVMTNIDNDQSEIGLALDLGSSTGKQGLSAWGNLPTGTEKKASIFFENANQLKKFRFEAKDNNQLLVEIQVELIATGYQFWSLHTELKSTFQSLPSFTIESIHNILDIDNISNVHRLTISPKIGSFLDSAGVLLARNFSVQVSIQNLNKITSLITWDSNDVHIDGDIQAKTDGNNFNILITSSKFDDIKAEMEYEFSENGFKITTTLNSKSKKFFEADITATKLSGAYSANVYISSIHLPTIDGQIAVDTERKVLEIFLKTDQRNVIKVNAVAQANLYEGNLKLTIHSSIFTSFRNIIMEVIYRKENSGNIILDAKYVKDSTNYHVAAVGAWTEDNKQLRLSSDGDFVGSVEVKMEDLRKITAFATHNKKKLAEIQLTYQTSISDFEWGSHVLQIKYIDSQDSPTDVSISIGVGPKRLDLEILTPFTSWTQIKFYGQVDLQSTTSKVIKLALHKEHEKLESAFDMKSFKRNGTTLLETEINVVGFKKLRQFLLESVPFVNISEKFSSDNKFTTSVCWSPSNFELKYEMPLLDKWKSVKLNTNWDLKKLQKYINFKSEVDGELYDFRSSAKVGSKQGDLELQFRSQNIYQSKLHYDFSKTYEASLLMNGPNVKWDCSGKLTLTNDGIQIECKTPIKRYENIIGKAFYKQLSLNHQQGGLEWSVNKKAQEFHFDLMQETGKFSLKLRTPVHPWEDLRLQFSHDNPLSNVQLNIERGDGKKITIAIDVNNKGNISDISKAASTQLEARISTPFIGLEQMVLTANYDRKNSQHQANISYNKNIKGTQFQVDFLYRSNRPQKVDMNVDMSFGLNQTAKAHAIISIDLNSKSTFATFVESNDVKHEVNAELDISSNNTKIMRLCTTLPFLKTIEFSLQSDEYENTVHALWQGNNQVMDISSTVIWKSLQDGRFNFSLTSPISGLKNVLIDSSISVISGKISAALTFQNENARWLAKLDGTHKGIDGKWNIQVNTPLSDFQDLSISLKHTWTSLSMTKELACLVERNSIKLLELELSKKESGLQLAIVSEIFEYPFTLHHHSFQLMKPESIIQMTVTAGDEEFKTNFEISVQGIKSGMINIKTSYLPVISSKFAWKVDGALDDGNAWLSFTNSVLGTKSIRTLWKKEEWKQMKAELWMRSNEEIEEKGVTFQYLLNSDNEGIKKLSVQLNYALENGTNSFLASASMIHKQSTYESTIRLETPFETLRKFSAECSLVYDGEVNAKFNSAYNEEHFSTMNVTMLLSVMKSNLLFDFNTPAVGEPFQILINYDFEFEKKTLEINLKQANYLLNIKNYLLIPRNQKGVELNSNIYSNVPVANIRVDGNLIGSYQLHSNGISEVTVTLQSAQLGDWKILGALRPSSDFYLKGKLESGAPRIPSASLEVNWRGNLRQSVSSDFSLIIGDSEYKSTISLASNYLRLILKSPVKGFSNISIEGFLQTDVDIKQADFKIEIDGEQFRLVSNCNFSSNNMLLGSGSVTFSKTLEESKLIGSLELSVEDSGKVEIAGIWRHHEFKINGLIRGNDNYSWIKSGTTDLFVHMDGIEQLSLHSTHRFTKNDWSLNITIGSIKTLKVHVTKGAHSMINSVLQWNTDGRIKFQAELKTDSFDIFFSSPWTANTILHGMFQTGFSLTTVEAYLVYDSQKSNLRFEKLKTNETMRFEISLDIPNFHQKLDTTIAIQSSNAYLSGGTIDMNVNGRQLCLTGEITTKLDTNSLGKVKESKFSLTLNIPSVKISKISSHVIIKKPVNHYGSMHIEANLLIGEAASSLLLGYDLPIYGNKLLGVKASLKSSLDGLQNYEFNLQSQDPTFRHVTGHFIYNLNQVFVNWKFTFPEANAGLRLVIANSGFGLNEYSISTVGYFDPSKLLNITIDAACKEKTLHFKTFVKLETDGLSSETLFYSPQFLDAPHHYKLKVNASVIGKYELEILGQHGNQNVDFFGDVEINMNSELQANAKIIGSYGSHYGTINYQRVGDKTHEATMTLESTSLLIGKKLNVIGKINQLKNGFESSIQCRTRTSIHTVSLTVIANPDDGLIIFKTESSFLKGGLFHADWKKDGSKMTSSFKVNYQNSSHKLDAFLDLQNLEGKLTISSSMIPSSYFNVHLKSIVIYDNIEILADVKIRTFHWRFEGVTKYESWKKMMIKLEVLTPYKSFDRLTLALKASSDEFYMEFHTPITVIPNAMLQITGLTVIQTGDWKDMHPSVTLGLPFGKYSAFCILKTPNTTRPGLVHLFFSDEVSDPSQKYEFQSDMSPLAHFNSNMDNIGRVHARIITPIAALEHFEIDAEGIIKGRNFIQISTEGKLNEHTSAFVLDYQNDNGNPKVKTELITPFKTFEKVAFVLSIDSFQKIGNGRSLHMEFENPIWNKIRLDTDYRYTYNGLLDMETEINAELISFMDIPAFHLNLKTGTKDSKFSGVLMGNFGLQRGLLIMETDMSEDEFVSTIDGMVETDEIYHTIAQIHLVRQGTEFSFQTEMAFQNETFLFTHVSFSSSAEVAKGRFKISTPWGPLDFSLTVMPTSPFLGEAEISFQKIIENTNVTFDLRFDEWRIVGFQLVSRHGLAVFEIYNPISPISLMLNFEHVSKSKLKLTSEFCWNLESPIGNTIGFGLLWSNRFIGRYIELKIQAENAGLLAVTISHSLTSSKLNQSASIIWNSPLFKSEGQSGYNILLSKDWNSQQNNFNFAIQVDLPSRSLMFETFSNRSNKESLHSAIIKWDLKRDDKKSISFKLHQEVTSGWKIRESLYFVEIIHPLSEQPFMLSFDQIQKDNHFQHIELDVKASASPESNFIVLISRNHTDWKNFNVIVSHAATKFLTKFDVKSNNENTSMGFSYMDLNGVERTLALESYVSLEDQRIVIHVGSKEDKTEIFKFNSQNQEGQTIINAKFFAIATDVFVQKNLPFIQASVKHDDEDIVKLSGGFLNKKKVGFQISGADHGNIINYILLAAELMSSNSISTKVNWYPNVLPHLMELDVPKFLRSVVLSDTKLQSILGRIIQELDGRLNTISPEVIDVLKNVQNLIIKESKLIYEEWSQAVNYITKLYDNNSMYLKDICGTFSFLLDIAPGIREIIAEGMSAILEFSSRIGTQAATKIRDIYNRFEGKLEISIMELWNQMENSVALLWHDNLAFVSSLFNKLEVVVVTTVDLLEGRLDELEKRLMAVGLIRKAIQLYKEYANWIEEIPIQEYVQNVESIFTVRIWDRIARYLNPILEAIQTGANDQYFIDLLDTPPLPYIRFVLKGMNRAFAKFWEVLEIEQRIKHLVRTSLKNVDGLVHRYVPVGSLEYDLENGIIEYNQSLSALQWQDFKQIPKWRTIEDDAQDVSQLTNFYYQVLDRIESLKPLLNMNIRSVLPPFGSYALMAGDYHYFTFDKKYFRFSGECSYLLVADISHSDDAFSLIVNYENRDGTARKKSYSILTKGNIIDVDISDFKVTVNGRKVELPLNVGSTFIRRHQTGLEMFDKRGFQMTCSLSSSVCTVGVSGWHFGKLAGLLGTYDNEQINDLRNPEGQIIPDVSTFAYSWRLGKNSGHCRMKNFARDETMVADSDNICHDLLKNRSSPLRPCFNTVDTEVFMEMCMYDISRNVNSANRAESACAAMSAYVTECQKNSVDVWMPPTCVRCKLEDGTALTTGENATLQVNGERSPPQSSDNVILLEETSCISASIISEAIKRLDLALNAEGIFDNRYSIIGFGGNALHEKPHIKTTSAQVWAHNTLLKISNDTDTSQTPKSDLYEAIQYAATLGFRAGVSKNLIAVTCGNEQCGDSLKYADILTLLVENDIKLHILSPKQFTLKGNRKQDETNQILGMDTTGVYTIKHAKHGQLEADKTLLRQMNIPKDLCTPLAMESNGTLFNIEQSTKKVLDVWSRRLAQTSHPSECQRCECVPDRYGGANLMCHQCVSPSLWRFMEEWKSYQLQDGDEIIPFDILEHEDFIMP